MMKTSKKRHFQKSNLLEMILTCVSRRSMMGAGRSPAGVSGAAPLIVPRLLLALLLCVLLSASAQAEINVQEYPYDDPPGVYRVTTFDEDMPEVLRGILAKNGITDYRVVCGATWQALDDRLRDDPEPLPTALVAIEQGGVQTLIGVDIAWGVDAGMQVLDLGSHALLPGRDFYISHPGRLGFSPRGFTVTYPLEGGGSETYSFIQSGMSQAWQVDGYRSQDANGDGFLIYTVSQYERAQGFNVEEFTAEPDELRHLGHYPYYGTFLLDYMDSIRDYPTTPEEAEALSKSSLQRLGEGKAAEKLGLNLFVNLREKPTSKSQSFGMLQAGLPLTVLGQEPGPNAPWYHVRFGSLEGYIAGNFLHLLPRENDGSILWDTENIQWDKGNNFAIGTAIATLGSAPAKIARSLGDIKLRSEMSDSSTTIAEFPQNTLMHVVTVDAEAGWLYVMKPNGEIGWDVDATGVGGYVRPEEIQQYATVRQAQADVE